MNKRSTRTLRVIAAGVVLSMVATMIGGCNISSRNKLVKYARNRYGACTFIREEHGGSGDDEYRTVYLKDKDTGIEYSVTSCKNDLYIDDSYFGSAPDTSSDFPELYNDWLLDEAKKDLKDLSKEYDFDYEIYIETFAIRFDGRIDIDDAFDIAEECDEILEEYDIKDMRPHNYSLFADEKISIGYYNTETGLQTESSAYRVIDFVYNNYDPDAVYLDSLGAYLNQFLSYEEIDELFPDGKGMTSGTAYYFRDSDGDQFIAIDLEDFGASGGIRLFRDKASGMEEIDI